MLVFFLPVFLVFLMIGLPVFFALLICDGVDIKVFTHYPLILQILSVNWTKLQRVTFGCESCFLCSGV